MNKKCSVCGEWLPLTDFYTAGKRRTKDGRRYRMSRCKACHRLAQKARGWKSSSMDPEQKKAYMRARSKALTRLRHLCPELYEMCLREALKAEGIELRSLD